MNKMGRIEFGPSITDYKYVWVPKIGNQQSRLIKIDDSETVQEVIVRLIQENKELRETLTAAQAENTDLIEEIREIRQIINDNLNRQSADT